MLYEKPVMELIVMTAEDIVTLSIGKDDYDPTIDKTPGNPSDNPWAK